MPKIIERKDPTNAEIFAISMVGKSLNASVAIKIDIVNPMPAKIPAPIICCQVVLVGSVPHLSCTVK